VFFGIGIGIAAVAGGISLEGGNVKWFLHTNTLLFVFGGTIGVLLASYRLDTWRKAWGDALREDVEEEDKNRLAIQYFTRMGRAAIFCGLLCAVAGTIHAFLNWGTMDTAVAGFAVALLGPVYGLVVKTFLSDVLRNRLEAGGHERKGGAKVRHLRRAA